MSKQKELRRLLKQTDTFLERAAVMLSTGKRGEPFPPNTEFSEEETKSYESSLITLACQLLKVPDVPKTTWYPPIQYAYRYVEGQKRTKWTWLEQFHTGLLNTRASLVLF